jgi:hypothetical protein
MKSRPINTVDFNFIEQLLVFRALPALSVPAESGVRFRISPSQDDQCICLLFRIDDHDGGVITEGVRPDYLAVFVSSLDCICTIIEMKGKGESDLKHGLDQIAAFADRLKREIAEHLPPKFPFHVQGIILAPPNAQLPNKEIARRGRNGLQILPATCQNRAELFPYVSKRVKTGDRFQNIIRSPRQLHTLEFVLSQQALKKRHGARKPSRPGIDVEYAFLASGSRLILSSDLKAWSMQVPEANADVVRDQIASLQLEQKIRVDSFAPPARG